MWEKNVPSSLQGQQSTGRAIFDRNLLIHNTDDSGSEESLRIPMAATILVAFTISGVIIFGLFYEGAGGGSDSSFEWMGMAHTRAFMIAFFCLSFTRA
jgi:hypothetical protein